MEVCSPARRRAEVARASRAGGGARWSVYVCACGWCVLPLCIYIYIYICKDGRISFYHRIPFGLCACRDVLVMCYAFLCLGWSDAEGYAPAWCTGR